MSRAERPTHLRRQIDVFPGAVVDGRVDEAEDARADQPGAGVVKDRQHRHLIEEDLLHPVVDGVAAGVVTCGQRRVEEPVVFRVAPVAVVVAAWGAK